MNPPLPLDALIDPVCGLVRSVAPVPRPAGTPARYVAMTADVSDARRLGAWPADRVALGTAFGDPDGARVAAVAEAEAVERCCGNRVPPAGESGAPGWRTEPPAGPADFTLAPPPHM